MARTRLMMTSAMWVKAAACSEVTSTCQSIEEPDERSAEREHQRAHRDPDGAPRGLEKDQPPDEEEDAGDHLEWADGADPFAPNERLDGPVKEGDAFRVERRVHQQKRGEKRGR